MPWTTYFAARSRPQSFRAWFERAGRGPSLAGVDIDVRQPEPSARRQPNAVAPGLLAGAEEREEAGLPKPDAPGREPPLVAGDVPPDDAAPSPSPSPSGGGLLSGEDEDPYEDEIPEAIVTDRKNIVISPHKPHNLIDVEGFARGEIVMDPTVNKPMLVP